MSTAPRPWKSEWINDECLCHAVLWFDWQAVDDGGAPDTWTPVLKAARVQRSLFCGASHIDEFSDRVRAVCPDGALLIGQRDRERLRFQLQSVEPF